jgi:mono/diheme cytochrome c family protein
MNSWQQKAVYLAAVLALATLAIAQTTSIRLPPDNPDSQLKAGAGEDVVRKNCSFCHSTDYIVTQPHLTAQQWDAEVKKMIAVYGAPINPADAMTIADYLARNYSAASASSQKTESGKP